MSEERYEVDTALLSLTSRGVKVEFIVPRFERFLGYCIVHRIEAVRARERTIRLALYRNREFIGEFYVYRVQIIDPELEPYVVRGAGQLIISVKE